jgi:UDP-2-acetamido-3-amino-2,3-dideoxy-glucuronate N-acetyltransferase
MCAEKRSADAPEISPHAVRGPSVSVGESVHIGPFTVIGLDGEPTSIGSHSRVAAHALIEGGAHIGARCLIDAFCRVCAGASIGDDTQILYGAAVFEAAQVGRKCIIGGNVADRTIIEDFVTFFGEIAHDYRIPGDLASWDGGVARPSPIIRTRSVVGQNALLIGGIEIGPDAYVAAGEVVRCNVPPGAIFVRGALHPLDRFRGLIQTRSDR